MIVTIFIACSIFLPLALAKLEPKGLRVGFYENSCPQAEQIVAEVVSEAYRKDPGVAAGFLRIFFHDCFVNVSHSFTFSLDYVNPETSMRMIAVGVVHISKRNK